VLALGVVVGSAGCDTVFGFGDFGNLPDADAQVAAASCATRPIKPFLCADFDDPDPVYYAKGTPLPLPPGPGAATYERRAGEVGNALWITSTGDEYAVLDQPATPIVKRLDATFAVDFSHYTAADLSGIFELGVYSAAFDQCRVKLEVQQMGPDPARLLMQSHCGMPDQNVYQDVIQPLPGPTTWLDVEFSVDLPAGIATTTLNGEPNVMQLNFSDLIGGTPRVWFGIIGPSGSPAIAFDSVVVTVE
jgi:hypothetical protein